MYLAPQFEYRQSLRTILLRTSIRTPIDSSLPLPLTLLNTWCILVLSRYSELDTWTLVYVLQVVSVILTASSVPSVISDTSVAPIALPVTSTYPRPLSPTTSSPKRLSLSPTHPSYSAPPAYDTSGTLRSITAPGTQEGRNSIS